MSIQKAIQTTLLAALVVLTAQAVQAETKDVKRTISVSGTGIVRVEPKSASLSVGVSSDAKTAGEALSRNSTTTARVIATLKQFGIATKDIQTTNFSVNPVHQRFNDGRPPVITGYRVENAVSIVVRDREKLGAVLDSAVSQGSNQINAIRFFIDDPTEHEDEARKRAMRDARRKADLFAEAGNVEVGDILSISESSFTGPQPVARSVALEARSQAVPIEAGELQLSATVNVTWLIAK